MRKLLFGLVSSILIFSLTLGIVNFTSERITEPTYPDPYATTYES